MSNQRPAVTGFHDPDSGTVSYVVACQQTRLCAVIDPVLDFDSKSGQTGTASPTRLCDFITRSALQVQWVLETHVHADHLSAAQFIKQNVGGKIGISKHIHEVQKVFNKLFNIEPGFVSSGQHFDHLFDDGEGFKVGEIPATTMYTPGHTPACLTYIIGDAAFVGDTLFMPDSGTARADFPGGDAARLFQSIQTILALAPQTRLFICHDYGADGTRQPQWHTTVAEQRASNIHVHDGIDEQQYVRMRTQRDATLAMPALILPSVQVNMCGGRLPPAEDNGIQYLKIPVNQLSGLCDPKIQQTS